MRLRNGKNTKEPTRTLSKTTNSLKNTIIIVNKTIAIIQDNFPKKCYRATNKRIDVISEVLNNTIEILETGPLTKEQQKHMAETLLERMNILLYQVDKQLQNILVISRRVALRKLLTKFMDTITKIERFLDYPINMKYNILIEFNKKVTDAFIKLT